MKGSMNIARTALLAGLALMAIVGSSSAQIIRQGNPIPSELRSAYDRGLKYLAKSQQTDGNWGSSSGVTGICLMAMIASGEDPNFGLYADNVHKAVRYIISKQDERTGFIATGMYEHGFAMLALADCYGAVDDTKLYKDGKGRTIAKALELAVRCAVTSQEKNPFGAWRYSPSARDADTSAAGSIFMGLLGSRNAGVKVPDEAIERALQYYSNMTTRSGMVGYAGSAGLGTSHARSSICTLVFAMAKRKDLETYSAARSYVVDNAGSVMGSWPSYTRYYMAQALFQADHETWKLWNKENTRFIVDHQRDDGSIMIPGASGGAPFSTGMALLSAALNYCFLPVYER